MAVDGAAVGAVATAALDETGAAAGLVAEVAVAGPAELDDGAVGVAERGGCGTALAEVVAAAGAGTDGATGCGATG